MADYKTAGSTQIWTLLRNATLFASTFRLGNRVTFIDGVKWPEKKNRAAGDYPEAKMRIIRSRTEGLTGAGSQKTFGNLLAGGSYDYVVDKTVTYELTLTYDGLDEVLPDQIESAIEASLFAAGATLGIAKARTWGPLDFRSEPKNNGTASGTLRLVQTVTIPVVFHLHRADIITP